MNSRYHRLDRYEDGEIEAVTYNEFGIGSRNDNELGDSRMTSQNPADSVPIPAHITRILVVEGPEDKTFFYSLAEHLGIRQDIHIVVCNGKDQLATTLTNDSQ